MKLRYTYALGGGLLLTLACGPGTQGSTAGAAGAAGAAETAGTAGAAGTAGVADAGGAAGSSSLAGEGGREEPAGGEAGGGSDTAGTSAGGTNGGTGFVGGEIPEDNGPQAQAGKVDLLLAVDNSISMVEKHRLFAQALPELVKRLVNPNCVSATGAVVAEPATPEQACPADSIREFEPLRDLHVGVITSSLGSHGAAGAGDVCRLADDDDHAHLLPLVRAGVASYDGKGFVKWDPNGIASPPGESDVQALADSVEAMIASVGDSGCGYEAQLESVYRFLVDPEPPQSVEVPQGQSLAVKVGIDTSLLAQRAAFLRPDSSVVVLMLTDENDCSIQDEGYGWLLARSAPMFRSTSVCHEDPNAVCCQSCGEAREAAGCPPFAEDSECQKGATFVSAEEEDDLNLRCFNQKGRFGFELLYPTARYVGGFGDATVPNRKGELVANPLFHQNGTVRDRSLFTLAVVGGVPWQDIATSDSLAGETLEYMTPEALRASDRWSLLLGDPANDTAPTDPFMRESVEPRSGKNPIIDASIVPVSSTDPRANPINGHEHDSSQRDLQYACTFELPEPIICDAAASAADKACDCYEQDLPFNRSVCNPPQGGPASTTQYYGKAYPSTRELVVARELGRRSVLGSVCARNTRDDTRPDYGYRPIFGALGRRIADTLVKQE